MEKKSNSWDEDTIEKEYEKDENGRPIYDENGKWVVKATYTLTAEDRHQLYYNLRKPRNPGEEAYLWRVMGEEMLRDMRYE